MGTEATRALVGLRWTQRVPTVFMVSQPKEEASQYAEKTGSGFPMGLCRSPFGSQITAQGCERAAQHISFSGNTCSCFARAWGRWGQARGRKKQPAVVTGMRKPRVWGSSSPSTAWVQFWQQGKRCPSSTLALLSSGPSLRAGFNGTRAFCLEPAASGTRKGFVLPFQARAHRSTDEPRPLSLALSRGNQ